VCIGNARVFDGSNLVQYRADKVEDQAVFADPVVRVLKALKPRKAIKRGLRYGGNTRCKARVAPDDVLVQQRPAVVRKIRFNRIEGCVDESTGGFW
jgi:hypothetical protein